MACTLACSRCSVRDMSTETVLSVDAERAAVVKAFRRYASNIRAAAARRDPETARMAIIMAEMTEGEADAIENGADL